MFNNFSSSTKYEKNKPRVKDKRANNFCFWFKWSLFHKQTATSIEFEQNIRRETNAGVA